jgi:hypothetical protein
MRLILIPVLILSVSCARKFLRSPSSYHSKFEAFTPGTTLKLRGPVELARKEETIHKDNRCEIQKYCNFEIGNDPLRRPTMRGEYKVVSVNEDEDKLILLTKENEKIQLDCGLKYTLEKISVANDKYCHELTRSFAIYTFPEFVQTIIDVEITYAEASAD